MNEKSLLRLIMKNWVNIWSIKSIIDSIANSEGKLETFQFGKEKKTDEIILNQIKSQLPPRISILLGILKISSTDLMKEITILNEGILKGSPKVEIQEVCDDKECVETIATPTEECPPQETIEKVKEEYIEICSTKDLECPPQPPPRVTPCTMDDCIVFAQQKCNVMINPSKNQ